MKLTPIIRNHQIWIPTTRYWCSVHFNISAMMQQTPVENTEIKMVSSRNFRGSADTALGKPLTLSQTIWLQLRSPFLLPKNGCVTCVEWECIEYGKMGCRKCGNFHVCCVSTCPLTEIENNHVCVITGAVVKTITYDNNEYLSTATHDTLSKNDIVSSLMRKKATTTSSASDMQCSTTKKTTVKKSGVCDKSTNSLATNKMDTATRIGKVLYPSTFKRHTVSHCINFHQRVCMEVLCSETTLQCYEKERTKLRNRLRWSFMKNVRSFKMRRRDNAPNVIVMISAIAADIENYRLPLMNDTSSLRRELANVCAHAIFKFTCSMTQSNAQFTLNLEAKTMIIGLLYLLRSGLVHRSITILPQYRSLTYLLPPENYINLFGVKSKIITETENIVKCHLRTLSDRQIKDIGYEAFDRLV
jgi:hypothetical protein